MDGWNNGSLDGGILCVCLCFCFLVIFCCSRFCYCGLCCCILFVLLFILFYVTISETRTTCHKIPRRPLKTIVAGTRSSRAPALNPHVFTNKPRHFHTFQCVGNVDRIATDTRCRYQHRYLSYNPRHHQCPIR